MTMAPAGTLALAPMAVITPFEKTIVPFAIGADVTGTMVALRIANVPFFPGLLMITDCAKSCVAKKSATATFLVILLLLRFLLRLRLFVRFLLQALAFLLRQL